MMLMEFAATWNWNRSQRSRAWAARSFMKSASASRSSGAVGLSCTVEPLDHAGEAQYLKLRLARPAADCRELVIVRVPIEVGAGLHHRDLAPANILQHLPGSHPLPVDASPAGSLVGPDPLLA